MAFHRRKRGSRRALAGALLVLAFGVYVVLMWMAGRLPDFIPVLYLITSIITYFIYASDKTAAIGQRQRTAEKSLHLLALAGGWPGALIAQSRFRHKTAKLSFQVVFWITVLINFGVLAWLISGRGMPMAGSFGL